MITFTSQRIAVFGDWHGNLPFAESAIRRAYADGADLFLHAGDFGFWSAESPECSHADYLPGIEFLLAELGVMLLFIDGNHEDHLLLRSLPLSEGGFREVSAHVWHIERGTVFSALDSRKIAGLGGAVSIDRARREPGVTWFPEEGIAHADVTRLNEVGEVDVLLTHESPTGSDFGALVVDAGVKIAIDEQVSFVAEARRAVQPQFLIHGHHHTRYEAQVGRTHVVGLGCDSVSPGEQTFAENTYYFTEESFRVHGDSGR